MSRGWPHVLPRSSLRFPALILLVSKHSQNPLRAVDPLHRSFVIKLQLFSGPHNLLSLWPKRKGRDPNLVPPDSKEPHRTPTLYDPIYDPHTKIRPPQNLFSPVDPTTIALCVHKYPYPPPLFFPFPLLPPSLPTSGFPTMMSPETAFVIPLPVLESGFLENQDLFSLLQSPNPSPSPSPSPGSDPVSPSSGSGDPSRAPSPVDDRKRRRMISNRESARRSRVRKQRHLEELRNQASRLRVENREIANRLRLVLHQCHLVWGDNDRLRAETDWLRHRLSDLQRILTWRQLQFMVSPNEQIPQLIA